MVDRRDCGWTISQVRRSLTLESIHKPLQGHLIIELVRTSMSNKYLKYFKPTYGTDYSFLVHILSQSTDYGFLPKIYQQVYSLCIDRVHSKVHFKMLQS